MSLLVSILEVELKGSKRKKKTYRTQGLCAPGNQEKDN